MIEEWAEIISLKGPGHEILETILDSKFHKNRPSDHEVSAPMVLDQESASSSSSSADEEEVGNIPFEFKDYSNCSLLMVLAKQELHIFDPIS